MRNHQHNDQNHDLYNLYYLMINLLTSPPLPIPFPTVISGPTSVVTSSSASSSATSPLRPPQVSPPGFAAIFIGISFAMMMFGSVIFVIGFLLMPLVVGLVMLFYLAGIVSNLTYLVGLVLCPTTNLVSAWRLS
uniref:uncharacterized protein LOC122603914 n=1 Tax=Erigeron canadensis TaxID=72917 RepID=UPI001CB8B822|nr:uncharacterized protein LOC122603914 [Erigeron canadensis]